MTATRTRYGHLVASGTAAAPLVRDRAFYATSFQFTRRASGLTSLASGNPSSLAALHVSPDSIARLLGAFGPIGIPIGIPIGTTTVPGSKQNVEGRVAVRLIMPVLVYADVG